MPSIADGRGEARHRLELGCEVAPHRRGGVVRTVRIGYKETLQVVLASPLEIRQCLVQRLLCLISRDSESCGQVAKAARLSCCA